MTKTAETDSWDVHSHELLTAFLCEMELLDHVAAANSSERVALTASCTKTQRRSSRMQIQDLLQQVQRLQSEVDGLRVNQLLGDSLEQFLHPRHRRPRWRLLATHEKQAITQATAENTRLKKRLRANQELIRRTRKLMQMQIASIQMRRCLPWAIQPLPLESEVDDARICNMMRMRIDRRCQQIDQLFAQCVSTGSLAEFSAVISHADGVGVDFKEAHIQPLDVKSTSDALAKTMDLDSVGRSLYDDRLYVRKSAMKLGADGITRHVKSWFLMRRIELENRSVLLWESYAQWSTAESLENSAIQVQASSWAVIEPIPEFGANGSFFQVVVSLHVQDTADKRPEISRILHLHEQFFNRRCRLVGNRLTDLSLKVVT